MVEKKEKNSEEWVKALSTPAKDCTANVQNLTEGQYYEFRVYAINTAGMSTHYDYLRQLQKNLTR